jgi:hypothetical protein
MTISAVPFALQNVPINADVVRQAISSLVPNGGGLVQTGDMAVTQLGTPAMGVQVGVGRAWIDGTNLAHLASQGYGKQGMYFVLNDAAYTVTISTSNATNPRIDVIYAAVPDTAYAGATNTPVIAVATGTAIAGASYPANAPSLPNNSIALAWVMVGAGVTSITNANITTLATGLAKPFGHMGKTDGFTGGTNQTPVTGMAAQILRGGMTFDSGTQALVVPITGLYRLTGRAYSSGAGTGGSLYEVMLNGAGGSGCSVWWTKQQVDEFMTLSPQIRKLTAGDKVSIRALQPASVYGNDGYSGTYVEVEYIGPA